MDNRRSPLRLVAMAALVVAAVIATESVSSQGNRNGQGPRITRLNGREVVEGEVLVRYRANVGANARRLAEFQAETDDGAPLGRRGARRLRSNRRTTAEMLAALKNNPDVLYAEPNFIIRIASTLPNDPRFNSLWGLFNTGQPISGFPGMPGADISATLAWDVTTGSRDHVVGVVDTGIDYNHPDLAANMWSAPRAFNVTVGGLHIHCNAGTHGYNAVTNSCNPMDDHSHGTHVAGTIGAAGNNGIGVTGVSWTASLMALKFITAEDTGTLEDAIEAIEFAIQAKEEFGEEANVRILSNSWGLNEDSQALRDQVEAANEADMLFVAAAGNSAENNDFFPMIPAAFDNPNVIAVAATTNYEELAYFSNYGARTVHLGAPGQDILSTVPNNGYSTFSGTSMAAPHVSGAAALVLAACPMTTAELKMALLASIDPVDGLSGFTVTNGRLNVNEAVQACVRERPTMSASLVGRTIIATVANGPGNPKDFVGLFCPATSADDAPMIRRYLNGTTTIPAAGLESATVAIDLPGTGGLCNVRFMLNGGSLALAASETFDIPSVPVEMNVLTPSAYPQSPLDLEVRNGPGNSADWVGLYAAGAANTQYTQWMYLNGSTHVPGSGIPHATLRFTAPSTPGTYEFRLFPDNTYTSAATSGPVSVLTPPSITINDVAILEGSSGTSTATFTVSLAPAIAEPVTVRYATLNGTAGSGTDYTASSGTLTFDPSMTTRTISVAITADSTFEQNETFFVTLSQPTIAVIADAQGAGTIINDDQAGTPTVTAAPATVAPGGTITATVTNGPGNLRDWVGLYEINGPETPSLTWKYLNGTQLPPEQALTDATLVFTAPTTPGTYHLRFNANGGWTRLATSGPIEVPPGPTLRVNDVSVTEGQAGTAQATFTVTLSPANATQTVTVNYATANGTAVAGSDYVAAAGALTFDPSVTSRTISVAISGDATFEQNETFFVNLSQPVNAVFGDAQGAGTIVNDDQAVTPTLTAGPATVQSGGTITAIVANGPGNLRDWVGLFAINAPDTPNLGWWYLDGTKNIPVQPLSEGTVVFTAPSTPGTYQVRFFANGGYTRLATSGSIEVLPGPTLRVNDVSVTEGHTGTAQATFTVTLSPANATQAVTVAYTTANGSATAGSDYVATNGTLIFDPSVTSRTISVAINGDATYEPNETFFVNLSQPVNAVIGDAQGAGTILNDDQAAGPPTVTAGPATVAPGGTITATVTNGPGNVRDWVGLYAVTGADTPSISWQYLNGTWNIPAQGLTEATLVFTAPTTPGTYQVRFFANGGYTRLATSGSIEVLPPPTLRVNDVSVTEGHTGTAQATFTVTLSPANPSQTVNVNYATANGTATAGSDYVAATGTLTFDPSVTSRTISVVINGDATYEPNETFVVNLSQPVNAVIGDAQGAGTILNDDQAAGLPTVTAGPATVAPGGTITVTVTNGPGNLRDWVGLYSVTGADTPSISWQYLNGTWNIPAQAFTEATLVFTAPTTPGTYHLRFFANGGYTRLATSGTIEVPPGPTLRVNDVSVTEGHAGTAQATFTVTLSPANASQTVTVNYTTANGTATAGSDYVAATGSVIFDPSVTSRTITVAINGDATFEQNETFFVNLAQPVNAVIGDAQGVGAIVNDDQAQTPTVTAGPVTVAPGGTITVTVTNGPGNVRDWVGLYTVTGADSPSITWFYLNGAWTAPTQALTEATLVFTAPTTPGTYQFRFFANGGYTRLATSATITVAP